MPAVTSGGQWAVAHGATDGRAEEAATWQAGRHRRRRGSAAPSRTGADAIRNVVLVGPAGSGKTTLVETLLVSAGVLYRPGSTAEGTTVSDFDEAEHRQQRSVGLALAPLMHDGVKINLLDTPGYADFVGELRAGLRAADCAMFVIAANEGVDEPTRTLWRECAEVGMPRAVVVTKLDHARADYEGVVAQAREAFGDKVLPVYLREDDRLVGLLTGDHEHDEQRGALIEGVIEESEDETLMERYLGGEEIDADLLVAATSSGRSRAGSFHPVVPVDSTTGAGAAELLDLVVAGFPSPLEHPLPEVFTPAGQAAARDLPATPTDRWSPRWSRRRPTRTSAGSAWSGCSPARCAPTRPCTSPGTSPPFFGEHASGHEDHDEDERIGALSVPARQDPAAGRRGASPATSARSASSAGPRPATPCPTRRRPLVLRAVDDARAAAARSRSRPAPRPTRTSSARAWQRLAAEDPTLRIEHNAETHQVVLWSMGEAHADVVLDRLAPARRRRRPGRAAGAAARDVRRTGAGHGPAREAVRRARPVRRLRHRGRAAARRVRGSSSSTRSSAARCPASSSPRSRRACARRWSSGVAAGYPVVDIRVTLHDGKAHSVDSSDMAFQTAGALALREAAAAAADLPARAGRRGRRAGARTTSSAR